MEKGRKPIKAQIPRRQQSPSPGRHRQQSPPISVYRAPSEEEKIRWRRARFFGRDEVVISRVWNPSDEFAHTLPSNDPHLPNDKQAIGQKTTRSRSGSREKILKDSAVQATPSTRETAQVVKSVIQEKQ